MKKAAVKKHQLAKRRANRTRSKIRGNDARPRLSIFRSSKHINAQVIDDVQGKTLVSSSDKHVASEGKKPLEVAALVGSDLAKKAQEAGVKTVVFDRGAFKYHGRVKALAEAAREGGLEF